MTPLGMLAIAQGGASILGGFSGKKAARRQARENAKLIRMETAETLRRTRAQDAMVLGRTTALAANSGVMRSGTVTNYMDAMRSEQIANTDWIQKSANQAIRAGKRSAEIMGNQSMLQGFTGGMSILARGYANGGFSKPEVPDYSWQNPSYYNSGGGLSYNPSAFMGVQS